MALKDLWARANDLGWLPAAAGRVVIQVGEACRSPLVEETAGSLAAFLVSRRPEVPIEILAAPRGLPGGPAREVVLGRRVALAAVAMPGAVTVPALWFEPFFMVTIAGAGPDPAARITGVLRAQADVLRRLSNPWVREALVAEGNRLAPSDLAISCGNVVFDRPASGAWWAIGPSATAVDQAVAAAAGLDPRTVLDVRTIACHELCPPVRDLLGALPRLVGYTAAPWRAHVASLGAKARASWHAVRHDASALEANLRRVPGFLRRRRAERAAGRRAS